MSRSAPDRYRWAVDILSVQTGDVILEIGCGYGHSIPLICEQLRTGSLIAIDRSEKMVAAASASNHQVIDSGLVTILHQDLLDRALPAGHFDKIFLYNINVFWMDPQDELVEISRLLKPEGKFYLFHQPPPGHDLDEFDKAFRQNLEENDFSLVDCFKDPREGIRSIVIISISNRR